MLDFMKRNKAIALGGVSALIVGSVIWALVQYAGLQTSLLWTAIIGAAAWSVRSNIEQKREYEKLLADRKREHYLQFLEFLAGFIGTTEDESVIKGQRQKQKKTASLDELRMWSLRLTLIGSDEVVQAWNRARHGATDPSDPLDVMKNWGKLWLAMRKDCGHIDTKVSVTDVLASFVNDIEKSRDYLDS